MGVLYHIIRRGINSFFYNTFIMRIRSVTIGQKIPILYEAEGTEVFLENRLEMFSSFNGEIIDEFLNNNILVDSKRICSQPLLNYEDQIAYRKDVKETLALINSELLILQRMFKKHNFNYFACCTMLAKELRNLGIFEKLVLNDFDKFIKDFPTFFTSLPVINGNEISFTALKLGSKLIKKLSEPDPINNLRFCINCNVPPNTPFFPAAYHRNVEEPAFSIAVEMADELVKVFSQASNLIEAANSLKKTFNKIYDDIINIWKKVEYRHNLKFIGIDFSPAPFPELERSIGAAVENLGIEYFGSYGTLLAIALITKSIPKKEKVIGFSGFMQPVLEDFILAKRNAENRFNLEDLLLYSTICGTGLDCIPLPGDITEKELFYILLDISTISVLHKKPLTARLMPIPGKQAGDKVQFDFEYFSPSRVMNIKRLLNIEKNDIYHQNEHSFNFDLL
ncbi:MAG: DUF711 family protein [Candidatus Hermodarchaeota archaeon]